MLEPSLVRDVLDAALATGGDFAELFMDCLLYTSRGLLSVAPGMRVLRHSEQIIRRSEAHGQKSHGRAQTQICLLYTSRCV